MIGQVATKIDSMTATAAATSESANFLCQELSHLLLYTTHMFQSGVWAKITVRHTDLNVSVVWLCSDRAIDAMQ